MILRVCGKAYLFEFGLNGLIYIRENLYTDENLEEILYLGLIKNQPFLTRDDISIISQNLNDDNRLAIKSYIAASPFISNIEVAGWYQQIVGEVGIQPSDFFNMTTEEMDLAYEGYIKRKETDANIYLLAMRSFQNKKQEIKLQEDKGYEIGSLEERNQTFSILNIKED